MKDFKRWLLPIAIICLVLTVLISGSCAPQPLGEVLDPSGNPFAHRFSDVKDIRAATFVVAASDSEHRYEADYFCDGVADDVQIQAALDAFPATGGYIFLLDGTYTLANQIARAIDDIKIMGCGQATLLNLDGVNPVITAGAQDGWLFSHFSTDAGGVSIAAASESAIRSVWIAGVRTDDPAAVSVVPVTLVVAANDSLDATRADYQCNGVNDHLEIQAAIDALPATGGEVRLLDGTYNIEVSLVLDSYQTLRGCGRNTILTTTTAALDIITATGGDGSEKVGILIADLCVDGSAGGAANDMGILWIYVDYSKIVNTWGRNNGEEGIKLNYCDFNRIAGNTCQGNSWAGIYLSDSDSNIISGNTCQENGFRGLNFLRVNNNVISGNTCQENGRNGMRTQWAYNNIISGNICQGNGWNGIYIWDSFRNTVTGNTFQRNSQDGINFSDSHNNIISGNTCIQNSQGADNTDDNFYISGCDYNLIEGNLCRAPTIGTTLTVGEPIGETEIAVTDTAGFEVGMGVVIDLGGGNEEYHRIIAIAAGVITIDAGLTNAQAAGETIDVPEAQYGINISNDICDRNCLIGNDLYDSGKTGDLNDVPTTNPTLKHDNRNLAGTGWLPEV